MYGTYVSLERKSSFGECLFIERLPSLQSSPRQWLCWLMQAISSKQADCIIYENAFRLINVQIQFILWYIFQKTTYLSSVSVQLGPSLKKNPCDPTRPIFPDKNNVCWKFYVLVIPKVMPANFLWSWLFFLIIWMSNTALILFYKSKLENCSEFKPHVKGGTFPFTIRMLEYALGQC